MATTFNFIGIDDSVTAEAVTIRQIDRAKFALVEEPVKPNGGREAIYLRTDTDPTYPVTIRQGYYPKANGAGANSSTRWNFWVEKLVDGVVVEIKPGSITLSTDMPFLAIPDSNEWVVAMLNLATWLAPVNETADNFHIQKVEELRRGIVNNMLVEPAP